MTQVFEALFRVWCGPYDPEQVPAYLRENPTLTYGQYAFEEGFKLGIQLAVASLDPESLKAL